MTFPEVFAAAPTFSDPGQPWNGYDARVAPAGGLWLPNRALPADEMNYLAWRTSTITASEYGKRLAGVKSASWSPFQCVGSHGRMFMGSGVVGDAVASSAASVSMSGQVRWISKATIADWRGFASLCPTNSTMYDVGGSSATGVVSIVPGNGFAAPSITSVSSTATFSSPFSWQGTVELTAAGVYRHTVTQGDGVSGTVYAWYRDSSVSSEPATFTQSTVGTVAAVRIPALAYMSRASVPGAARRRYIRNTVGGQWLRTDTGTQDFALTANSAFDASDHTLLVSWVQTGTRSGAVQLYTHGYDSGGSITGLTLKSTIDLDTLFQSMGYAAGTVCLGACIRSDSTFDQAVGDKYLLCTALTPDGLVVNLLFWVSPGTGQASQDPSHLELIHSGATPIAANSFAGYAYNDFQGPYVVALATPGDQRVIYVC